MAKTLEFYRNASMVGGTFTIRENGTTLCTQTSQGMTRWDWGGGTYNCKEGGTANLRSDGVIAVTYTYNSVDYTEFYQGTYGSSGANNLPQIAPNTANITFSGYAGGTIAVYDDTSALLWSGSMPCVNGFDSPPFTATATRSGGSASDTTATLVLDFANAEATLTLSGGTVKTYDLTGHTSYETDSEDWLIYTASALPEKITAPTPMQLTTPDISPSADGTTFVVITRLIAAAGETVTGWQLRYALSADALDAATPQSVTPTGPNGWVEITGLTGLTDYYWQAKALGDGTTFSDSEWSSVKTCRTNGPAPVVSLLSRTTTTLTFLVSSEEYPYGVGNFYYAYAATLAELTELMTYDEGSHKHRPDSGQIELLSEDPANYGTQETLAPGQTLWFAARDNSGNLITDWSEPISATTLTGTLSPPVLLAATPTSPSEIALEWSESQNAAGYLVRYRINGSSDEYQTASFAADASSGSVSNLTPDTTWVFQIQATGNEQYGASVWSLAMTSATPAEPAPILPTVTLLGAADVSIPIGSRYADPGATAVDHYGRPLIPVQSGSVETDAVRVCLLVWTATDSDGLSASAIRTIHVINAADETTEPVWEITLGVR